MSAHDTHNADTDHSGELKSKTAFRSSFWFVIILVGLFIAALNFVRVMGNDHESAGGHEAHGTEHHDAAQPGKTPMEAEAPDHAEGAHDAHSPAATDSAAAEAHN